MNSLVNDCISIENNIKRINEINKFIKKSHVNENIKIYYSLDEYQINNFLNIIKSLGTIEEEGIINYELYNDFDIQYKNPIQKINNHTDYICCLIMMKDGRLVSGARDCSIIIYNKASYKPDLIIKEHNERVVCIIQLKSGILASGSYDSTIKLFNINGLKYELLQTLSYHTSYVYKIIELTNNTLVSCSSDSSIIFYTKDNLEYKKDYSFSTDSSCNNIIQTKCNEICYSNGNNNKICFYDLLEKKKYKFNI